MDELEKIRKEKLAEFFFNLSNTTVGSTVVGVIVSFVMDLKEELALNIIVLLIFGTILSIVLANIGHSFLKK